MTLSRAPGGKKDTRETPAARDYQLPSPPVSIGVPPSKSYYRGTRITEMMNSWQPYGKGRRPRQTARLHCTAADEMNCEKYYISTSLSDAALCCR
ncbi:jg7215 [Pararge aegeria aegeria]|uniref:Jg7215 protein n=1 Tax=Pararge aegeria aegeria TaxID=348720 RepID=A0A8S4SCD4_9NEOP|nr:jg7215 [Pararge aegeria aegeria]